VSYWEPQGEWSGRTVAVVGTGPSLTLAHVYALSRARARDQVRIIAVNDAVFPLWCADVCFAGDSAWWQNRDLNRFKGRKVGLADSFPSVLTPPADLFLLRRASLEGCDLRPGWVATHGNSGAIAIQAAAQCLGLPDGGGKLCVVGFDLAGSDHFFGSYDRPLGSQHDKAAWRKYFAAFPAILGDALMSTTSIDGVRQVELADIFA
jgi:hypothetical protein